MYRSSKYFATASLACSGFSITFPSLLHISYLFWVFPFCCLFSFQNKLEFTPPSFAIRSVICLILFLWCASIIITAFSWAFTYFLIFSFKPSSFFTCSLLFVCSFSSFFALFLLLIASLTCFGCLSLYWPVLISLVPIVFCSASCIVSFNVL